MTKPRAPGTVEEALVRIAAQVPGGFETMGARVEFSAGYVRAWGDPSRVEQLPLTAAIELDLLFLEHGGDGTPCHEHFTRALELAHERRFGDRIELARAAVDLIAEAGEAGAFTVAATLPGATRADRQRAVKELIDLDRALKRVLPQLQRDEEAPP